MSDLQTNFSEDELAAEETGDINPEHGNTTKQEHIKSNFVPKEINLPNGLTKKLFKAPKSSWVANLVYLDGKPFSFKGREYLIPIYDGRYPRRILKYSRQTEKSTALANDMISNSIVKPYNKSVYIAPSHSQVRQFSSGKLTPWMKDSPVISKYFLNSRVPSQVFEKGFANGSLMWLRSAFLNADRVRGLSANELYLDEIQDILSSNIPVILEVLSHAENPAVTFSGTPLTLDNPIETYWQQSSQCEWLVPCDSHTPKHWNFLDERCLGKKGPICNKCGRPIDPTKGQWISFNNNWDIAGFHVNQLQVPWMQSPDKWKELLWKHNTYSKGQFYNEVLGLSYDSATKPISRQDLIACCSSQHPFRKYPDTTTKNMTVFAGVDWGEGSDGTERNSKGRLKNASYTVLTLGAYISPKHFHYFFAKRYSGDQALPRNCVPDILKIIHAFGAKAVGVDWGFGWGVNDTLEEKLGRQRVMKFQHNGMQKERKKYDDIGNKLQLNRTEVMTDFFDAIKRFEIVYPAWEDFESYLVDIEHVHAEYSESARGLRYDHKPSEPDDALHSMLFCKEAADHFYGKV